jgi:hypothetical protein
MNYINISGKSQVKNVSILFPKNRRWILIIPCNIFLHLPNISMKIFQSDNKVSHSVKFIVALLLLSEGIRHSTFSTHFKVKKIR